MSRWPDEMLNPCFQPGDAVEVCNLLEPVSRCTVVTGEEFLTIDNGDVGKVCGFRVVSTHRDWLYIYYDIQFETTTHRPGKSDYCSFSMNNLRKL